MNTEEELTRLLAAERIEMPEPQSVARGLEQLRSALGAGAGGLSVAHGPLKLGVVAVAKWSVISGVAVFAALSATLGRAPAPASAVSAPAASVVAVALSAAPAGERGAPLESPTADALDAEAAPQPANAQTVLPHSSASGTATTAASSNTFSEELRLIKSAKRALDAGQDREAMARLSEHARLYPGGVFASERDALSVLVDCRAAPAQGRAAARRFIQQNPGSPLVDRLARACNLEAPARGEFAETPAAK